ncbi:hypothetical protein BHU72_12130 [Desulfuribacillus stibiiarsenatis]|uniref:Uncharacterized protein n=1 Tax=Desulfuribacillus stibiiarsenatis TaxID=1390249 RepID=A0A1E5L1W9_9FIRM|nr:hypothetical protein [Desulfuribacillus stibiiarsenatis]OEH84148.1 hypothetical protein BHU72_12130 [Desulfuribacillus stibiiarsenatis]
MTVLLSLFLTGCGSSTTHLNQYGVINSPTIGSCSPDFNKDSIIKMKFEWNGVIEELEATLDESKIPFSLILSNHN